MTIETIHPTDTAHWQSLRRKVVTSTEVSALFGCNPYASLFEIWHRKHDNLEVEFEENERIRWGSRLEKSIAEGVAEDDHLNIRRMNEFIQDTDLRLGASFDYAIGEDGILEIKNVDSLQFKNKWEIDGENVVEPLHIGFQVQVQLMLSRRKYVLLRPLVGGNKIYKVRREPDAKVHEAIRAKVKEFWKSVAEHREPKPDFERDSELIGRIYGYADPGKVMQADEKITQLAHTYKTASDRISDYEAHKDAAKAELLTLIGNAEKVTGPWGTISAGLVGPKWIEAYERKGYRSFKVSFKKEKSNV